jgi:hypothetical protein
MHQTSWSHGNHKLVYPFGSGRSATRQKRNQKQGRWKQIHHGSRPKSKMEEFKTTHQELPKSPAATHAMEVKKVDNRRRECV